MRYNVVKSACLLYFTERLLKNLTADSMAYHYDGEHAYVPEISRKESPTSVRLLGYEDVHCYFSGAHRKKLEVFNSSHENSGAVSNKS